MSCFSKQTIQDAVQKLSERPLSIGARELEYARGYPALVALASRLKPEDENAVIALAYAAYGWMPTVLKKLPDSIQIKALGQLIGDLNASDSEVLFLLQERRDILQSINGSVVGVSKFLHFCIPKKIPIWDSRIGKIFGCNWGYQVNNVDNFLSYVKVMGEYLKSEECCIPAKLLSTFNESGIKLHEVSTIRKIELCLFLEGGFR
jgi:hypothetical protein